MIIKEFWEDVRETWEGKKTAKRWLQKSSSFWLFPSHNLTEWIIQEFALHREEAWAIFTICTSQLLAISGLKEGRAQHSKYLSGTHSCLLKWQSSGWGCRNKPLPAGICYNWVMGYEPGKGGIRATPTSCVWKVITWISNNISNVNNSTAVGRARQTNLPSPFPW